MFVENGDESSFRETSGLAALVRQIQAVTQIGQGGNFRAYNSQSDGYLEVAPRSLKFILDYPITIETLRHAFANIRRALPNVMLNMAHIGGNALLYNGKKFRRYRVKPPLTKPQIQALNGLRNCYPSEASMWNDKESAKRLLDSDFVWFQAKSGNKYGLLGNIVLGGGATICELDYSNRKAVFRSGTMHELEDTLKQRGFEVLYKEKIDAQRKT